MALLNLFKNKFPKIKAKYYVIEPHYIEGTPPDWPVSFSGSSTCINVK